jgi:hypothetical protein
VVEEVRVMYQEIQEDQVEVQEIVLVLQEEQEILRQ